MFLTIFTLDLVYLHNTVVPIPHEFGNPVYIRERHLLQRVRYHVKVFTLPGHLEELTYGLLVY